MHCVGTLSRRACVQRNLLYAMIAALEDSHWSTIAKNDSESLLNELQEYKELEALFNSK